ncbi:MAG: hypothetical protein ACP5MU_06820 [Thermoplasmata archaeon]
MTSYLEFTGILGLLYILIILILSVRKFSSMTKPFIYKSIFFFIFSILPMLVLAVSSHISNFYVLFVITEFLFTLNLFYNYLKSNFTFLALSTIFSYMEDIMIIVAIYFSFYITGSLLQSMTGEKKGSFIVLSSFLALDVSFILQAFYILRMFSPFLTAGIIIFFLSVAIFMTPFLRGGRD